ncbi:MAG: SGNH/GDSL hydrolase family protein [Gemmatimonadota bacterium]|nr:SGNH/GDSL hydrolase family protein [Gemmatimonadota bacterium]
MSSVRRRLFVRIVFVLVVYFLVEGVAFGGLLFLRKTRGLSYFPAGSTLAPQARQNLDRFLAPASKPGMTMDPDLGWLRTPGFPGINTAGMRDDREYNPEPDSGVLRIAAFGDSFTYGSDVPLGENWAKRIPAMNPAIEVLNYGVGASGVDQAYLRYLKAGADFHPHVVLIGFMTENIGRHVNVYRGFYSRAYGDWFFTKPRFRVEKGELVLIPNPLRSADDYRRLRDDDHTVLIELGRNDFHYAGHYRAGPFDFSPTVRLVKMVRARIDKKRQSPIYTPDGRYDQRSEAYAITIGILDAFYRKVLEAGALPIIVVFPDLDDQQRSREGKPRRYAAVLNDFNRKGYRYIDALQALEPVEQRYTISDLSVMWGHYSKLGNDIVAQHILRTLGRWNLDQVSEVKTATATERRRLGIP